MNSRRWMTATSVVFGGVSVVVLFAPVQLLSWLGYQKASGLTLLLQVLGVLLYAMALLNWMARKHVIGGIHARPITMANLAHCFAGSLVLGKHVASGNSSPVIVGGLAVYLGLLAGFYGLVFHSSGVTPLE